MKTSIFIALLICFTAVISCNNEAQIKEPEKVEANIEELEQTNHEFPQSVYLVAANKDGVVIKQNPNEESAKIGLAPYAHRLEILDTTQVKDSISTQTWLKTHTYDYSYLYYNEGAYIDTGYVLSIDLKSKDEFVNSTQEILNQYSDFKGFEPASDYYPYILFGDFFGDGEEDMVVKIKDSLKTTLGFIDNHKSISPNIVIIDSTNYLPEHEYDTSVDFSWTQDFKIVPKDSVLERWADIIDEQDYYKPRDSTEKPIETYNLHYNALWGHLQEACGGGYIFWYDGNFKTITGD